VFLAIRRFTTESKIKIKLASVEQKENLLFLLSKYVYLEIKLFAHRQSEDHNIMRSKKVLGLSLYVFEKSFRI